MSARAVPLALDGPTNEQLVAAHLDGDPTALDILCRRHWGHVRGYILNNINVCFRDEANDLTQEVFKYLVKHVAKLRDHANIQRFLFTTAYRLILQHRRNANRLKRDVRRTIRLGNGTADLCDDGDEALPRKGEWPRTADLTDTREAEKQAAHQDVAALLDRLTPVEAEAVRMKDVERYTAKAAAEALGIPQSSFDFRYRKAWARLEKIAAEGR